MQLTPSTEAEAASAVLEARAARRALVLRGGGTRAGLGRPVGAGHVLSSAGLVGITLQEPAELVVAARAGTPVRVVTEALSRQGQMLPFEPMGHGALYGTAGEPTVGGLVAANASGPRRIAQGAVRDHLIGVRLVNGHGEVVKSGGRVMKNVTGLDLVKLECGAHGTLGFLTEVTFKVLPKPEAVGTLAWRDLDDARAIAVLTSALGSPYEPTGAAHLPAGIAGRQAVTLLRVEGFAASVDARCERLASLLASNGSPERLPVANDEGLWGFVRDATAFAHPSDRAIWRISVPPSKGPEVVGRLGKTASFAHFYDWAGGLIWVAVAAGGDCAAGAIRAALKGFGGHATLVRAPDALRASVDVFEPLSPALHTLTAAIKASFDPERVFNPGRMYQDI